MLRCLCAALPLPLQIAELKAAGGKCSLSFFDQRGPGYIQLVARIPTLAPSALFSAAAPAALLPFSHFGALSLEECKGRVSGEHSRLATLMKLLSDCTCVSPFQGTAEVIDDEAQKKAKFRPGAPSVCALCRESNTWRSRADDSCSLPDGFTADTRAHGYPQSGTASTRRDPPRRAAS